MIINKIFKRIKEEYLFKSLSFKTKLMYNNRSSIGNLKEQPHGDFCDLAVVTFNVPLLVEYQIRTLNKYFSFPFRFTVFDNSTQEDKAKKIKNTCDKYGVGYIRLPKQDFLPPKKGSFSHGIAINYLYEKFIKDGGSKYFGLLDHDIFPINKYDVSKNLKTQPYYGLRLKNFLWPGLFFIRTDFAQKRKLDFRPSLHPRGDTGASNYNVLFKTKEFESYSFVNEEHVMFEGFGNDFDGGFSIFDNTWIHCWNASNYLKKENVEDRMKIIYNLLEKKLQS